MDDRDGDQHEGHRSYVAPRRGIIVAVVLFLHWRLPSVDGHGHLLTLPPSSLGSQSELPTFIWVVLAQTDIVDTLAPCEARRQGYIVCALRRATGGPCSD